MFHFNKPNPVFFVARSHSDLSWYLSINSQKRAANDRDFKAAARSDAPDGESNVLYYLRDSPSE